MDKSVITNELSILLDERKVIAGVFTTFNFEPDFFELDVIPELLDKGIPYSSDDRVKTFQVRETLRESGLTLSVFFDLQIFRNGATCSPQMEYLCHGINSGNNAFHAKNIYLLVETADNTRSLLVGAGSNNITRAGWWRNIEAQHWEEVKGGNTQRAFLNRLREDFTWLQKRRSSTDKPDRSLDKIESFLNECQGSNSAPKIHYFSLQNKKFFNFLKNTGRSHLSNYSNWNLEIISPYFSEDQTNNLHDEFKAIGINEITMLLPFDYEKKAALCHQQYYEHIEKTSGITWGRWKSSYHKALGVGGDSFRRVHAKIYHFYNGMQSWAFIGSINFSKKATGYRNQTSDSTNIESGFLVKLPKIEPMLRPLLEEDNVEEFNPPIYEENGTGSSSDADQLPELHLSYDWKTKELMGRTSKRMQYNIQLLNPEKKPIISPWNVKYQETYCRQNTNELEDVLKNGSLLTVIGTNGKTSQHFREHKILIQQIGWTHKPIDLPHLTAEQILAIYVGMNCEGGEQRQTIVLNALLKKLFKYHLGGELTEFSDELVEDEFFCEYAEIFHAFKILKGQLLLLKEEDSKVDYYLTGSGMDSLPVLIKHSCNSESEKYDAVRAYLLLLCVREIYSIEDFKSRSNVKEHIDNVKGMLKALKIGYHIKFEGDEAKQQKFFRWFEKQFFQEYSKLDATPNHSEVSS